MPPSPALKCSPGRELRGETHKRGRSFESGLLGKEKDDDLALFNEMQTKEKESFLLQSSDDLEDLFSTKLKQFSDFKLGISIPARGESSELLNVDGEKNDYDWLLTPPDTPLFPSLDDEPTPATAARRGRPRSQPISISRSSTMEKSQRSSRGSASPNRLSPSPRSGNSSFQSSRGRPASPNSGATPALRSATPTRRPSPSPSKPLIPGPRSATPPPRRMSTGSRGNVASSGVRGTSPVRTSRGNSASPKIRAWQSNIPGFSLEAPPNLRTSLADRPASYVRGSSPASRNGRDSTSKFTRQQSMSPTPTRSVSSSHSHDRDRFSSHSKGSVASSGDDDADSLQSIPVGSSDHSVSKRVGAVPNNRSPSFSKKPAKILSSSSAPKRSFDSALRQMDHRKTPTNMFRPLLSSVPSTTFYVGKGSSAHRSMISRNSSIATSSNVSSDQGTGFALDTEGNDHQQDGVTTDCGEVLCPSAQEEVFAFDKMDALDKDVEHESHEKSSSLKLVGSDIDPGHTAVSEEYSYNSIYMETSPTSKELSISCDFSEVGTSEGMRLCSQCGLSYMVVEVVEKDFNICPECRKQNVIGTVTHPDTSTQAVNHSPELSVEISEETKPFDKLKPSVVPEYPSQRSDVIEAVVSEHQQIVEQNQTQSSEESQKSSCGNAVVMALVEEDEQNLQQVDESTVCHNLHERDAEPLQLSNNHLDTNFDTSEGAGISLLLKKTSSNKGPVLQGRTFTASNITYGDLTYVRDSTNSLRSSVGHGSGSASSSVDFTSSRQTESRLQRQLSDRKSDMGNSRYDTNPQSSGSSLSGSSNHTHQALGSTSSLYENFEVSVGDMKYNDLEGPPAAAQSKVSTSENKEADIANTSITGETVLEEGIIGRSESRTTDASTSEMSSHTASIQSEQNSVASFPNHEDRGPFENGEDTSKIMGVSDAETSVTAAESSYEDQHAVTTGPDEVDVAEIPAQSSLATITEIEVENSCQAQISDSNPKSESVINEGQDSSVPPASDNDIPAVLEPNPSDNSLGISEESTVLIESHEGNKGKSLTLEEATDAILFCSSIVHDLAYRAATIAIENEGSVQVEDFRPTVTVLGKSNNNPDRKDSRSRTTTKHNLKPQKPRQRRVETKEKSPPSKTENDENADQSTMRNVGLPNNKVDSMKAPPKLESKCNCTIM